MILAPPDSVGADDAAAVIRCFEEFGAVQVRGAVDPEPLARVREAAARVFAERELSASRGELAEALTTDYVRRFIHIDCLGLDQATVDALVPRSFLAVAAAYLGAEATVAPERHVRSILTRRSDTHLPFHQDESILGRKMLNVWLPLAPCGVDAPGLELVLGSWVEQLQVSPPPEARYAVERAMIAEDAILARFGPEPLWRPAFTLGDALLFSGRTAHRTYATPQMTRDRMSVELRLI
jgi:ectoine hydroxylase-related dioxygenase (phytanoyl-CoA dioxygenase family)